MNGPPLPVVGEGDEFGVVFAEIGAVLFVWEAADGSGRGFMDWGYMLVYMAIERADGRACQDFNTHNY